MIEAFNSGWTWRLVCTFPCHQLQVSSLGAECGVRVHYVQRARVVVGSVPKVHNEGRPPILLQQFNDTDMTEGL